MEQKAWVSCAFFFGGIEFIYWNMKWAVSNQARNPAWVLVSNIHLIAVLLAVCIGLGLCLFFVVTHTNFHKESLEPRGGEKDSKVISENITTVVPVAKALEVESELFHRDKELRVKNEEERQQKIIEAKKRRSAEEAVKSALDDFL